MAFNPFSGFRKHRKTVFAVMTIICMFVFILSSGLGGKADLLNMTFLGSSDRIPKVASLDGRTIKADELERVKRARTIANEYMRSLVYVAGEQVSASLQSRVKDMDPIASRELGQVLQMRQFLNMQRPTSEQDLRQISDMIQRNIGTVGNVARGLEATKKTEDLELVRTFQRVLATEHALLGREFYFTGSARRGEDLLDFLVLKWVADNRDITISPEVVKSMIRQETFGQDVVEAASRIEQELRRRYGTTSGGIIDALTDEFRVRIAQRVAGVAPGMQAAPSFVTPHEFYKFYLDQRTAVRVNLLPVSVEAYLAKVSEQPTEADLRDLFQKHAREEPNPESDVPGFKSGKKVKVEWIGVKVDNPLFKKAALEKAQKDSEQAAAVKKMLSAPPIGNLAGTLGFAGALFGIVENPKLIDKRIEREYESYVATEKATKFWTYEGLTYFSVHDRNLYQPQVVAAGVADMLMSGGTRAPLIITGPAAWGSQAIVQEMRDRIRFGLMPFAFAGPRPHALMSVSEAMLPKPLPREALAGMLKERVASSVETEFTNDEFRKFEEDVAKKAKDIKSAEAAAKLNWWERWKDDIGRREVVRYVDDFVKKYGLSRGASTELRDRFELINDPGLKALKEAYLKNPDHKGDKYGLEFGSLTMRQGPGQESKYNPFFHPVFGHYNPTWFDRSTGSPFPSPFSKPEDEFYMAWKTEEVESKVRKFEEAKAEVERTWKMIKARELARKDAEAMQKELRDKAIRTLPALKDYALQHKTELVEVGPIAKLMEDQQRFNPMQPSQYTLPTVPGDKVPYAGPEFAEKLVDLRDKPIGETIVLPNAPKTTFYTGVLTERIEPTMTEFESTYTRSGGDPQFGGNDPLLRAFEAQQREKAIRANFDRLRAEARLETVPEELAKYGNRGGSDE